MLMLQLRITLVRNLVVFCKNAFKQIVKRRLLWPVLRRYYNIISMQNTKAR